MPEKLEFALACCTVNRINDSKKQTITTLNSSRGDGFSIKVKDSKIVLKNCSDPFKEPEVEEWFVKNMPYEKIIKE